MQIFYENFTIQLQTIANTLFDLKQQIANEIPELKDREVIFIIKQPALDLITLVEEISYKSIIKSFQQEIQLFCFSILNILAYKEFYNRIMERINQIINKQMNQNSEKKEKGTKGMINYQQENSELKKSISSKSQQEQFQKNNLSNSFQKSIILLSEKTSQLRPKKYNNEFQQKNFVQNSESDLEERDLFVSRNYQSTIFVDSEIKCWRCNIYIKQKSISLICNHSYHLECFTELLQQQLEQKKQEIQCMCNKKIPKITYHLESMGSNFKQKYLNNQLDELKWKYQKYIKSCKECKYFIISFNNVNINSYCQHCEQFQDFS